FVHYRLQRRCLHQLEPRSTLECQESGLIALAGIDIHGTNVSTEVLGVETRQAVDVVGPNRDVLNTYHGSPNCLQRVITHRSRFARAMVTGHAASEGASPGRLPMRPDPGSESSREGLYL